MEIEKNDNLSSSIKIIGSLLRFLGVSIVLASAIAFMVEGWYSVDHVARYYKFLGATALMVFSGYFTSKLLAEEKGALTFKLLALTAIPINFCQVAAIFYSTMPYKIIPKNINNYLLWEVSSISLAFTVLGTAILALSVLLWVSLKDFKSRVQKDLFTSILFVNTLLLVPLRGYYSVIILFLIASLTAYSFSKRISLKAKKSTYLSACKILLWIPSGIILVRTASLYDCSFGLLGIIIIYLGVLIIALSKQESVPEVAQIPFEFIGASLLIFGITVEIYSVMEALQLLKSDIYPVISLILIGTGAEVIGEQMKFSDTFFTAIVHTIICFIAVAIGLDANSLVNYLLPIIIGSMVFYYAKDSKNLYLYIISVPTFLVGLGISAKEIIPNILDSWFTMLIFGIGIVFLASFLEKKINK